MESRYTELTTSQLVALSSARIPPPLIRINLGAQKARKRKGETGAEEKRKEEARKKKEMSAPVWKFAPAIRGG